MRRVPVGLVFGALRRPLQQRRLPSAVLYAALPAAAVAVAPLQRCFGTAAATPRAAVVDFTPAAASTEAPPTDVAADRSPAEGAAESSEIPVRLRDNAIRKLLELQAKNQKSVLRIMVSSGGCSGYSYEFSLVDSPGGDEDVVMESGGAMLVVDEVSLSFMEACEVDYVEEMIRSSFQVVKNKLADAKCGCGSSFNVAAF
mmetsp:Transcript_1251/g.3055  ORF Transcript_1251/g.3055 Transcript_1251/m.3055 type:complete len:200 (-) Transcript_1251:101-700(-)